MKIKLARIKKAIVAGVLAGVGAAITHQVSIGVKLDAESIGASFGAFVAFGVPALWATYKARNEDSVNGSYPRR